MGGAVGRARDVLHRHRGALCEGTTRRRVGRPTGLPSVSRLGLLLPEIRVDHTSKLLFIQHMACVVSTDNAKGV